MISVIHNKWLNTFLEELKDSEKALLISPFITGVIVDHLLSNKKNAQVKLITRYNLNDFRCGVSDLPALRKLVEHGIEIKGIKGLHSKVYLFDLKSVIIGSANFTSGGFFNNFEFGILTNETGTVVESKKYFEHLWSLDTQILTLNEIVEWEELLKKHTPINESIIEPLPDFGKKITLQKTGNQKYYIKLFGRTDSRVNLNFTTREEIKQSHCHWALTFSGRKGMPRRYNDGDIVYMARMLVGGGYSIFGKAIALKYDSNRDNASDEDIEQIDWKEEYPVYIRIHTPEFIDGTMADCPKMDELIYELKFDSFKGSQQTYLNGGTNINPRLSLSHQADVQLTEIAAQWLENKFQEAKTIKGAVPISFTSSLYQGMPTINDILNL